MTNLKYCIVILISISLLTNVKSSAQITAFNDSIHSLGLDYFHGRNGKFMDRDKGVSLVLEAAELGNTHALCNAGILYTEGIYVQKNDSLALSCFVKAADLGDSDAMDECGLRFAQGKGFQQDHATAFKYFLGAANAGNPNGAFNLAVCYQNGEGTEQNYTEAIRWYRFAAEYNHAKAQYHLAKSYYLGGNGVKKDLDQSYYWAKMAGENGIMDGLNLSGIIIQNTRPIEAFDAFKKAYEGMDFYGRRNYADALREGIGCEKNIPLAFEVYREGCESEDPYCQYYLGILLIDNDVTLSFTDGQISGKEVKKFAENLLKSSAEQGFEDAKIYCDKHNIKYKKPKI